MTFSNDVNETLAKAPIFEHLIIFEEIGIYNFWKFSLNLHKCHYLYSCTMSSRSRTESVTKDNCTNMHLEKLNCHKKEQKRNLVNEDITHYILTGLALRVVKMSVSFCNVLNFTLSFNGNFCSMCLQNMS